MKWGGEKSFVSDAKNEAPQYDWQPGTACEQDGKSYSFWFQVTSPPLQDVIGGCVSHFFLSLYDLTTALLDVDHHDCGAWADALTVYTDRGRG